jgi:hypothetical protein
MWSRSLFVLLLSSAAMAQTQYGSSANPATIPHGQTGCPWLSQGSAAHALGGDVSATMRVSNGEGTCSFSRQPSAPDMLEIAVSKAVLPVCPPGSTSLRGIGNEAMSCRHGAPRGDSVEMISSRVREVHFTVTLTTRSPKNSVKPDDPQNDVLEQIAEQVAGNLY